MTIRSSPNRAMSPSTVLTNSHNSFTAFLMSLMLLFARGLTLTIIMLPDLTSRFIVSKSERFLRGIAFK